MMKTLLASLLVIAFAVAPAAADKIDYAERAEDLSALSRIFGELHHIRRACEPREEADVWRDRMRKLIELEMPQTALRQDMVGAFNAGFRSAGARFDYCDRDARDYAASIAARGDEIATRLVEPLYAALTESYEMQRLFTIDEAPSGADAFEDDDDE
ncbi:MAG: TIGR02301 family protein [Parvularculaceae bacterium]